jgi:hypothetical protein
MRIYTPKIRFYQDVTGYFSVFFRKAKGCKNPFHKRAQIFGRNEHAVWSGGMGHCNVISLFV